MTTIKVSNELRDQLKEQARAHGRTLGDHLQALADDEARRQRFRELQWAMVRQPADETYAAEAREWADDRWS